MPKAQRTRQQGTGGGAPSGAKGGLGQHFLSNPAVIQKIIDKAKIQPHDIVLEVGPGSGVLTFKMLPLCKKLVAIEIDSRMVVELNKKLQLGGNILADKLEIINANVLKTQLPFFNLLVANIPYNISSPLLFKLLTHRPVFRAAIIMFQEEFAQRLTAKPGEESYGRLSVNVQLLAEVDQLLQVSRVNFRPPPKVDSRVVRITPRVPAPNVDFLEWDGLVRLCFNRKNKTIRANLTTKNAVEVIEKNIKTFCSLKGIALSDSFNTKEIIEKTLTNADMLDTRVNKLSVDDFLHLLNEFNKNNIRFSA